MLKVECWYFLPQREILELSVDVFLLQMIIVIKLSHVCFGLAIEHA